MTIVSVLDLDVKCIEVAGENAKYMRVARRSKATAGPNGTLWYQATLLGFALVNQNATRLEDEYQQYVALRDVEGVAN
jgi:hypothetical protein